MIEFHAFRRLDGTRQTDDTPSAFGRTGAVHGNEAQGKVSGAPPSLALVAGAGHVANLLPGIIHCPLLGAYKTNGQFTLVTHIDGRSHQGLPLGRVGHGGKVQTVVCQVGRHQCVFSRHQIGMLVGEAVVLRTGLALQTVHTVSKSLHGLTDFHGLGLALGSILSRPPGVPTALSCHVGVHPLVTTCVGSALHRPAHSSLVKVRSGNDICCIDSRQIVIQHCLQSSQALYILRCRIGLLGLLQRFLQELMSIQFQGHSLLGIRNQSGQRILGTRSLHDTGHHQFQSHQVSILIATFSYGQHFLQFGLQFRIVCQPSTHISGLGAGCNNTVGNGLVLGIEQRTEHHLVKLRQSGHVGSCEVQLAISAGIEANLLISPYITGLQVRDRTVLLGLSAGVTSQLEQVVRGI